MLISFVSKQFRSPKLEEELKEALQKNAKLEQELASLKEELRKDEEEEEEEEVDLENAPFLFEEFIRDDKLIDPKTGDVCDHVEVVIDITTVPVDWRTKKVYVYADHEREKTRTDEIPVWYGDKVYKAYPAAKYNKKKKKMFVLFGTTCKRNLYLVSHAESRNLGKSEDPNQSDLVYIASEMTFEVFKKERREKRRKTERGGKLESQQSGKDDGVLVQALWHLHVLLQNCKCCHVYTKELTKQDRIFIFETASEEIRDYSEHVIAQSFTACLRHAFVAH